MPIILIQNGGHKQCEGYVTFKMVGITSVKAMWHWKKNFLDKGRNVEQDVMNKLWKVYVTNTVRK